MERLMSWVIKGICGVLAMLAGFFVGWILRAVKAKRQLKDQKETLVKKEEE